MRVEAAYQILFSFALVWFSILILFLLIRSIIGPGITDRILCINMTGTMVICCITILSRIFRESYLADVALIYAMISFISVLILANVYIPFRHSRKGEGSLEREKEEQTAVDEERQSIRVTEGGEGK